MRTRHNNDDDWEEGGPSLFVFDLPEELWAIIARYSGFVGTCRLMDVCRASLAGARCWLRTLPGMVVCGGRVWGHTADGDFGLQSFKRATRGSLTSGR